MSGLLVEVRHRNDEEVEGPRRVDPVLAIQLRQRIDGAKIDLEQVKKSLEENKGRLMNALGKREWTLDRSVSFIYMI